METTPKEIGIYRTENGVEPFTEWFDSLRDARAQARIDARLARVRAGLFGDFKAVNGGVCEMRIDYGAGYRIYFGQQGNAFVILLCGGDKSTQRADIKRARNMWQDYKTRVK